MAKTRQQTLQHFAARPNEGALITTVRQGIGASGQGANHVIDLSSAPVPDRRYAAEESAVLLTSNMVRMLFGQTKAISGGLSSLLVIHVPFKTCRVLLNSGAQMLVNAREHLTKYNVPSAPLMDITMQTEPAQTAIVEANIIAAAFAGREATLDFYHVSSFGWHSFGLSGKLYADPTVRVTLPLPVCMSIFEWISDHQGELPADEVEGFL